MQLPPVYQSLLGSIAVLRRCGLFLLLQTEYSVVGMSVCLWRPWVLPKRLNRSRCLLGGGIGCVQRSIC